MTTWLNSCRPLISQQLEWASHAAATLQSTLEKRLVASRDLHHIAHAPCLSHLYYMGRVTCVFSVLTHLFAAYVLNMCCCSAQPSIRPRTKARRASCHAQDAGVLPLNSSFHTSPPACAWTWHSCCNGDILVGAVARHAAALHCALMLSAMCREESIEDLAANRLHVGRVIFTVSLSRST